MTNRAQPGLREERCQSPWGSAGRRWAGAAEETGWAPCAGSARASMTGTWSAVSPLATFFGRPTLVFIVVDEEGACEYRGPPSNPFLILARGAETAGPFEVLTYICSGPFKATSRTPDSSRGINSAETIIHALMKTEDCHPGICAELSNKPSRHILVCSISWPPCTRLHLQ